MSGLELVQYERRGNLVLMTLNRPEQMNALNTELVRALRAALARFGADREACVGVLAANGRAFCAGADLEDMKELLDGDGDWVAAAAPVTDLLDELEAIGKPIVAAVQGWCVGAGLCLAHRSALVVASESARFGLPEVAVGMPNYSYFDIWKFVGARRALEMSLTGDPFDAAYAREIGLINRVVADDQVLEEALKLAERVGRNAPLALAATQRGIRFTLHHGREEWPEAAARIWADVLKSDDLKEGLAAFKEKRKPSWTNR
ncbi:MAG: enoyl-CoA hydratase/isomerase family protein [Gammaproteobacteria bacterium]|nr:enoyl-CoA hydratase/isomerase family protein [Gammaproteobacteria bacterium]